VVRAAAAALKKGGIRKLRLSRVISTAPLGPSSRRYANAAVLGVWDGGPAGLLAMVKGLERRFGRRRGRRWGARVLDCDILAFGAQRVLLEGLEVPHPRLQERLFVLEPMGDLWPDWRHPGLGLTVRQMAARLRKPRAVD
jgi:2-amino-4-hydroxy-6-hydroxymethyldihydropteridine diphosphokinase